MDIIPDLLNIPQEDILSSSSSRSSDGTLTIDVTLVSKTHMLSLMRFFYHTY